MLAEHADRLPVGDPTRADVAMGPIIDAKQRDNIHCVVTSSVDAGAQSRAGGTGSPTAAKNLAENYVGLPLI